MVYQKPFLLSRTPGDVRSRDRQPFPGTDPRHIKGLGKRQIAAGMTDRPDLLADDPFRRNGHNYRHLSDEARRRAEQIAIRQAA